VKHLLVCPLRTLAHPRHCYPIANIFNKFQRELQAYEQDLLACGQGLGTACRSLLLPSPEHLSVAADYYFDFDQVGERRIRNAQVNPIPGSFRSPL
jgi:hypothetical protein